LLRIVLIGYLYGISSERKLVEELRMHLAFAAVLEPMRINPRTRAPSPSRRLRNFESHA
jgi:transposase